MKKSNEQTNPHSLPDVIDILESAVKKIDIFTQPEASSLDVKDDGSLIAKEKNFFEKIIAFLKSFLGSFLFSAIKNQQEKKLFHLKQEILQARDILQSHSALIDKLKTGDLSQQKLAGSALEVIQRYNAILTKDYKALTKYDFHNYERNNLLSDKEIEGQLIQLPHTISIKYDANVYSDKTHMTLKKLGLTFQTNSSFPQYSVKQTTHKKAEQFMLDTFRMKAIRSIKPHLPPSYSMTELLYLIQQSPINMEMENELVIVQQQLTLGPGTYFFLSGSFKQSTDFMSMPIIDQFHLSSESSHTGFPYPSQHIGWALSDELTRAHALRTEQLPLYKAIELRKKQLSQQLLFDNQVIAKSYQLFKLTKETFDRNKTIFLSLHKQLQEVLLKGFSPLKDNEKILSSFYEKIEAAPSPFNVLTSLQEEIIKKFIHIPAKQLEDEWLENHQTILRSGNPQERFQRAKLILEQSQHQAYASFADENETSSYLKLIGFSIGKASQNILLQYFSEKIGYAPPMLNDCERRIQICAFDQLLTFLEEMEKPFDTQIDYQQFLIQKFKTDLILLSSSEECRGESLVNELEIYFNSRYSNKVLNLNQMSKIK
jgi:hypothetical protein